MPFISLDKETPKEAVCKVFEKVNTGGVSLTIFELLTATYAADGFRLRQDWEGETDSKGQKIELGRRERLREYNVLGAVGSTDFLQAVTLLATYLRKRQNPERAVSCKRKDILALDLEDYKHWAEPATEGFIEAAKFLHSQKIFSARDIPYRTQLVPLAAILTALGERAANYGVKAKLAQWFWCGVFGELYGSAVESRFAKDLPEVMEWIEGGQEPDTIREANFLPDRLLSLRTRLSAAYKGLHTLLLRDGGRDFRTGNPIDLNLYFDEKIDIHHIFPKNWCKKQEIEPKRFDSIVNKAPIDAKTNRMIGGKPPGTYLPQLQSSADITKGEMDEILRSHVIDPEAVREDNFEAFFEARRQALLQRIEKAMGKHLTEGATGWEEPEEFLDYEEEILA